MTRANEIGEMNVHPVVKHEGWLEVRGSMTIRQAYKIAAMQGLLASFSGGSEIELPEPETVKSWAASYADAMLAEDSEHEAALSGKGTEQ